MSQPPLSVVLLFLALVFLSILKSSLVPGYPAFLHLGLPLIIFIRVRIAFRTASLLPVQGLIYCMGELAAGSVNELTKRFEDFCGGGRGATANVDDVIACFNYLTRLGTTRCVIAADGNQHEMCTAGTAGIDGVNPTNHETIPSGIRTEIDCSCFHCPADTHAAVLMSLLVFNGSLLTVTTAVRWKVGLFAIYFSLVFFSFRLIKHSRHRSYPRERRSHSCCWKQG